MAGDTRERFELYVSTLCNSELKTLFDVVENELRLSNTAINEGMEKKK